MDHERIRDIYPFESHYFSIQSHRYHYVDEGEGDPVLMSHGNPTWSFFYRRLISEFSTTHRVIAPDHLGCGLSDKPQDFPYRLETHIDNLESLILSLDLKNITIVAHDWGAAIALGFAVRYPKMVKALVILNSAAFSSSDMPFRIALCRIPFLGSLMIRKANLFCLAALRMAVSKEMPKKVKDGYLLPYGNFENRVAVDRFVQDIPIGLESPSYEVLIEIEHGLWMFRENPVALIWGMKDWCFTPKFLDKWRLLYPQAEILRLPEAGHYLLEDAHEEIIPWLRDFFKQHKL